MQIKTFMLVLLFPFTLVGQASYSGPWSTDVTNPTELTVVSGSITWTGSISTPGASNRYIRMIVPSGLQIDAFTYSMTDPATIGSVGNCAFNHTSSFSPSLSYGNGGVSTTSLTSFSGGAGSLPYNQATTELLVGINPAFNSVFTINMTVSGSPAGDTNPPVIMLTGTNPQTIGCGGSYIELGATANDDTDGDITANIIIDDSAVNTSTTGSYTVNYNVSDAAGNPAATVSRMVNITDSQAPTITLLGDNPFMMVCGDSYSDPGATAMDACDGDISTSIIVDNSAVMSGTVGNYTVTYNVMDATGNPAAQMTRAVNITAAPVVINGVCFPNISAATSMAQPGETIEIVANISEVGPLTIPAGVTLNVGAGLMLTATSGDMINNGTVTGTGTLNASGAGGQIINNGTMTFGNIGSGALINNGTLVF